MRKELQKLIDYRKKSAARRRDGIFLIEGVKMYAECPRERILSVYFSESFVKSNPAVYEDAYGAFGKDRVFMLTDADFLRVSDTKTPQGVLAVVRAENLSAEAVLSDPEGLYLFLESVQDPGNVGTILRSAEAAGVSGVVLNADSADVCNPKVIRSTMGSVFRMKFAVSEDLPATVKAFQASGGRVYAAHLKGSIPYTKADYRGKCAFLIGNESQGLSDALSALSDARVRIPMAGQVESLNAAMAATVLLYEAVRQRGALDDR